MTQTPDAGIETRHPDTDAPRSGASANPLTSRLVGAALALLQEQHGRDLFVDSSNLTLITGPSRTGDIEQSLTIGVHGPREMHCVVTD